MLDHQLAQVIDDLVDALETIDLVLEINRLAREGGPSALLNAAVKRAKQALDRYLAATNLEVDHASCPALQPECEVERAMYVSFLRRRFVALTTPAHERFAKWRERATARAKASTAPKPRPGQLPLFR